MPLRILIDMNLPPAWCELLRRQGWDSAHWSEVGDPRATDAHIMHWARENGFIVFTHDLDFGALLAATGAIGPSVIQTRAVDVMPESLGARVIAILRQLEDDLSAGALVTIDEHRHRLRVLPIGR